MLACSRTRVSGPAAEPGREVGAMAQSPAACSHVLVVVERRDVALYEALRAKYAGVETLTVILDRRRGRRRRRPSMRYVDRRRADRRTQPALDELLRSVGYFSTVVPDPLT